MNAFPVRARTIAYGAIVAAFFAAVLVTSHRQADYLAAQDFAGCYVSANSAPLLLSPSGSLRSRHLQVGTFKVLAPVPGKHGPLVEADALNVIRRDGQVIFLPGSGGFLWPVTARSLRVTFAPDGELELARRSDAACR